MDTDLAVGEPARQRAGVAILAALGTAAAYGAVTVVAKQAAPLYVAQPWQDDPYDALVSFDVVGLPVLVAVGAARVQLCRRRAVLPVRRVVDLVRACLLVTLLALATQAAQWQAVLSGAHRSEWSALTTGQVAGLAVLTALTLGAGLLLRRAHRGLAGRAPAPQPDWLADAVTLGRLRAGLLGPLGGRARALVAWADRDAVPRVRAHPVATAALAAVALTLPQTAAVVVLEGYPAPLVLFVSGVSAAALFAFVVGAGAYLRVVAPAARSAPSGWLCAAVAACAAAPLAVAFRDRLWAVLGADPAPETVGRLAALVLGAALVAGALAGGVRALLPRRG